MKKFFAIFLVIAMLVCSLPLATFAKAEVVVEGARFKEFIGGTGVGQGVKGVLFGGEGNTAVYDVEFPETGNYILEEIQFGYASNAASRVAKANVLIDGKKVGAFETPEVPTGVNSQVYETDLVFPVEAGQHELRIEWDIHAIISIVSFKFKTVAQNNSVDFSKTEGAYKNVYLPAVIEAEDFDLGFGGSFGADGKNDGRKYRKDDAIDIYQQGQAEEYYIRLQSGDWTKYTFKVQKDDAYALKIASTGTGKAKLYFDGNLNPATVTIPATGSFAETDAITVLLTEGIHSVMVEAEGILNIDYLHFITSTGGEYITLDQFDDLARYEEEKANAPHPVYKELYVSPDGDDENSGEKDSPFKTVKRAKEEIAKINDAMEGDIVVNFASGYYYLPETEYFTKEHGGKNGYDVIFRGEEGENKPIIGGGVKVTGWEQTETPEIFKAQLDSVEDTRTLYINGYAAQRARSKYRYTGIEHWQAEGSPYESDGFTVSKHNFPKFSKPEDLELSWKMLWTKQRMPVADIIENDDDTYTVVMDQPYWNIGRTSLAMFSRPTIDYYAVAGDRTAQHAHRYYIIENAIELLDEPGEFYFDKETRTIYYYPFFEEDMETAEAYVGTTEMMMKFNGENKNDKLKNLVFDNLSFRHGAWNELSKTGKRTGQADKYCDAPNQLSEVSGGAMVPAQIQFNFADNIRITNCEFMNMGSGAVSMVDGVTNVLFEGNIFRDISGTGIIISSWDHGKYITNDMEKPSNVVIRNNMFRRPSNELTDTCGISIYYADNISITNNYMKDVPYTGITAGWGWATNVGTPEVGCSNVDISYNRFENVMMATSDGGAVYTLGNMVNTMVSNNYINYARYGNGGIYFDNGTSYATAKDNVVLNVPRWQKKNPGGGECFSIDNFTNMKQSLDLDSYHPASEITITGTTYLESDDISGYPKAVSIEQNAGLTAEYKHLAEGLDLPQWRTDFMITDPEHHFVGRNTWSDVSTYVDFYDTAEAPGLYEKVLGEYTNFIGDTTNTEWQEYDFEIHDSGTYTLKMQGGQPRGDDGTKVRFWCDGEILIEAPVPTFVAGQYITGTFEVGQVYMEKGVHRIRVEQVDGNMMVGPFMFDDGTNRVENDEFYDEGTVVPRTPYVAPPPKPVKKAMFEDIERHWAKDNIERMAKQNVIKGVSETHFAPEDNVTLYQAIWLAFRAAHIQYTDDNWKQLAVDYGMLKDINEGDASISRERFADVLIKVYVAVNGKYNLTYDEAAYADIDSIDEEYFHEVLGAKTLGIMSGKPGNNFEPKSYLTRAEAATAILRIYGMF